MVLYHNWGIFANATQKVAYRKRWEYVSGAKVILSLSKGDFERVAGLQKPPVRLSPRRSLRQAQDDFSLCANEPLQIPTVFGTLPPKKVASQILGKHRWARWGLPPIPPWFAQLPKCWDTPKKVITVCFGQG
jgi:hypothetical protein